MLMTTMLGQDFAPQLGCVQLPCLIAAEGPLLVHTDLLGLGCCAEEVQLTPTNRTIPNLALLLVASSYRKVKRDSDSANTACCAEEHIQCQTA